MEFKTLIMPKALHTEPGARPGCTARFTAEPFERGFGQTIGNTLRRVLLNAIQGAAITAIRIDGVTHEYEGLEGCKEDISDIILNLKQMRIKFNGRLTETTLQMDIKGPKLVTAGDFELEDGVEILNPEQPIATLAEDGSLVVDAHVALGRGYVPAHKEADEEDDIGIIPVDSSFSPILNVTFLVEDARVGQRTDYDRLIIEVTTDGTVNPEEALSCSARIMRDHLAMFIQAEEDHVAGMESEEGAALISPVAEMEEKLDRSIEELELSVRSFNCLEAAGIKTIRDLVRKTESEMLKYRNFGRKSLSEIKNILKEMGLTFSMKIGEDGMPVFPTDVKKED